MSTPVGPAEPAPFEVRARSFGAIAEHYERYRPAPPPEAVDWVLPEGCRSVVELGAGTGALTRQLASRVPEVVAVEPDAGMRAEFVKHVSSPVVGAVGEALPLRADRFEALVAASAWHWMDRDKTVPEVARVLRSGGTLGLLWNTADRSVEWVHDMLGPRSVSNAGGAAAEDGRPHYTHTDRVQLPEGSPFCGMENTVVEWSKQLTVAELVGLASSYSRVITLPDEHRVTFVERVETLARRLVDETAGDVIDLPMRCDCYRVSRT